MKISKRNSLNAQIKQNKTAFAVYCILRGAILAILIRNIFTKNWENCFICILSLILMLIPPLIEKAFRISLPTLLEVILFCFIFAAEILGEIHSYYVRFPLWDTMLHTLSGFIFAAFGFCLVDLMNREKRIGMKMSPVTLAIVAFCFSMTIGVLWEFFEYFADTFLNIDMQKDTIISSINTVTLDPTSTNTVIHINDITQTVIYTEAGDIITLDGYIDIGIIDTMKDLLVNFIGAVVFSIIGFFYVKHRGKGKIAPNFIPIVNNEKAD